MQKKKETTQNLSFKEWKNNHVMSWLGFLCSICLHIVQTKWIVCEQIQICSYCAELIMITPVSIGHSLNLQTSGQNNLDIQQFSIILQSEYRG